MGLEKQSLLRAYCDRCRTYRQLESHSTVQSVPPVLVLNAALDKYPAMRQVWANPSYLPEEIGLYVEGGRMLCFEGNVLRNLEKSRRYTNLIVYELVGFVADINSGEHQKPHLVSLINGLDTYRFLKAVY